MEALEKEGGLRLLSKVSFYGHFDKGNGRIDRKARVYTGGLYLTDKESGITISHNVLKKDGFNVICLQRMKEFFDAYNSRNFTVLEQKSFEKRPIKVCWKF